MRGQDQAQDQGMLAEDIRAGTLIGGRRVAEMARGTRNGRRTVTVRFDGVNRRGRKRLSDPVTYLLGTRVPGTRRPTTYAMPAGPVRPVHQPTLVSKRVGRGEDESRRDFHSRLMDSVVYG